MGHGLVGSVEDGKGGEVGETIEDEVVKIEERRSWGMEFENEGLQGLRKLERSVR